MRRILRIEPEHNIYKVLDMHEEYRGIGERLKSTIKSAQATFEWYGKNNVWDAMCARKELRDFEKYLRNTNVDDLKVAKLPPEALEESRQKYKELEEAIERIEHVLRWEINDPGDVKPSVKKVIYHLDRIKTRISDILEIYRKHLEKSKDDQ